MNTVRSFPTPFFYFWLLQNPRIHPSHTNKNIERIYTPTDRTDPHAGNLLACPDGRLCYLDFGMMSYANQKQRNGFLLAVIHIVNRDWDELAKLYVRLGFIPPGTDLDPTIQALEQALPDNVLNSDISELNFKNVINSLGDVFYTFPFSLPPFYIAIIRCLGVLEGLAIQVDPSIKVISE
jgi:aarF domain-containing kinase